VDKKRFEVKCPTMWSEINNFEESTYDEVVKIEKGIGYCSNVNSAERLKKLGYTVRDLNLVTKVSNEDKLGYTVRDLQKKKRIN